MKFLLDENIPPSLVGLLQGAGIEARHVCALSLANYHGI